MDAKKITEDYHDWHNIAELRLLGLSRSQIAKKLQLPPGRVMRLSRLNVDELLQHGNRPRLLIPAVSILMRSQLSIC